MTLNEDEFITCGWDDKKLCRWSLSQNKKLQECDTQHSHASIYDIQKIDERNFATCDGNGQIKIWCLPEFQNVQTIKAHDKAIMQMTSFDNDNQNYLASSSYDTKVKIWKKKTNQNKI